MCYHIPHDISRKFTKLSVMDDTWEVSQEACGETVMKLVIVQVISQGACANEDKHTERLNYVNLLLNRRINRQSKRRILL